MRFIRLAAALLSAALAPVVALAQTPEWPAAKPIVYVVPFTPGGSTDIVGRTLAQKLGESLKQSVVVDNKPGQAGGIGAAYVARAAPDGYTLFGGTISTHAINASLYKKLTYDPMKDFEPVSLVARLPNVLIVNSQLGVNSVAELVALLKKDESKRTFASSGAGTSTHLAGEMFADLIGVKLTHVPYKGTPPALTDVAAGQVPFMFDQVTAALPLVKSGKLKLLAVTTGKRIALVPELPTMIESGIPGFEMSSWQAVYAPKGTPRPIVQRLNAEIVKALRQPDVQAKLSDQLAMEIVGSTPEELRDFMAKEIPRWAELVKKSGAVAD
ncbi:tripartite tricarboxylate transporter substrate binding protein [Variovorax paradoxus]|jgi:tripartite-type tricarboxylate transporter receptor subunit TctC|uniref:Bug family tripartite tricarboxylate transporter substrate binding protein n=1 Tax=Variovorax TaxID=34072 RepID=UPI000898BA5D|nr:MULTISPECIES: tripartite tricarboxylate transporter substrate binding protein [Variovorax]UVH54754.1 tripartite tricarboxylate transporter substrate binding protein [Variovorax paradoxus]SDZ33363.1 Tripartite-type tricarboxylate transporter, receptor component TctC [Variovorax sp. YR634]SDZ48088.1 Tripartite-type tricarboxylate transporter, receptor component TctC [Variovorax sp. YR266]SOD28626.1 Tripartite-type tricarboxylate transporter, receptor component TctC [Variovorax sp. YR752]